MSDLPKFDRADFNKKGYTSLAKYAKEVLKTDYNHLDYIYANLCLMMLDGYNFTGNFRGADFSHSSLVNTTFTGADENPCHLDGANFAMAKIGNARFEECDLSLANLSEATLKEVTLSKTNMAITNFSEASLADVTFSECDGGRCNFANGVWGQVKIKKCNLPYSITTDVNLLCEPEITDSNLYGATFNSVCPETGAFEAWKIVDHTYLVQLRVPADAKRSSAATIKCRCSKAKVLDIVNIETRHHVKSVVNHTRGVLCKYEVGKIVKPDSFDPRWWNECSHGIHFFLRKEQALNYCHLES